MDFMNNMLGNFDDVDTTDSFFNQYTDPPPQPEATIRAPAQEEKKADYVSPATIAAQIPAEQVVPLQTSSNVDAVVNNPVVDSLLEDGVMDAKKAAQCRQIIGYAPLNIMDPRVQQQLAQNDPQLASAFRNPMTKGFAGGINQTSSKICKSILLAAISRTLLDSSLSAMGIEAEGRSDLVKMSVQIQRNLETIALQTQEFVKVMAKTIKAMGETAFSLKYDADPEQLLVAIRQANLAVVRQVDDMKQAEEDALLPIRQGIEVIKSNLQANDAFTAKEELVKVLKQKFDEAENKLIVLYQEQYEEKTNLMAEDHLLQMQIVGSQREVALKRQYAAGKNDEIRTLQERITMATNLKENVRDQVFEETRVPGFRDINAVAEELKQDRVDTTKYENMNAGTMSTDSLVEATKTPTQINVLGTDAMNQFRRDFQGMVANEIRARVAVIDERIKQLQKREGGINSQAERYRDASRHADDGYRTRTTTTTSSGGWWLWRHRSTTTTSHRVKAGYNEKERLQGMAREVEGNLSTIRRELEELRAQREQIPKTVRSEMQALSKQKEDEEKEREQRAREQAAFIDKQKRDALAEADARNRRVRENNQQLLAALTAENSQIVARNERIINDVQTENERIVNAARAQFYDDKKKGMDLLNQQIQAMQTMMNAVQSQRTEYENSVLQIEADVNSKSTRRTEIARGLAKFEEKEGEIAMKVQAAKREEEYARGKYEEKRAELERFARRFGISNGEDFAAFMQMFQLLNVSIQNLPAAMLTLSKSFEAAQETFSGDYFNERIMAIPEARRGEALADIANDLQSICQLGWKMFDAPMDSLIQTDAVAFLEPLVQQGVNERKKNAQKAIEGRSGPTIEEVTENDEVPRRS